jgi:anti-anti-sigma factor
MVGEHDFEVGTRRVDGRTVVAMAGELDATTLPTLVDCVGAVMVEPSTDIVFDLSRLTFIDSSGVNFLVRTDQTARARGAGIVVRSPARHVHKVLDICGVTRVLRVEAAQEA